MGVLKFAFPYGNSRESVKRVSGTEGVISWKKTKIREPGRGVRSYTISYGSSNHLVKKWQDKFFEQQKR